MSHLPIFRDRSGQGLTEYVILVLLVAVVSISAVKSLGGTVKDKLQQIRKQVREEVTLRD